MLLSFSMTLTACFLTFQYLRERQFKVEILDGQLQSFNRQVIRAMEAGMPAGAAVASITPCPFEGMRVTVVDTAGNVIYDNSTGPSLPADNHLNREEIAQAKACGMGRSVRRHSDTTSATYFYSATGGAGIVVRSAVPYGVSLSEVLQADSSFLWFMLAVATAMSVAGYFATRRIGRTISRLNSFAERAEKGERIYDDMAFPSDELGSISNHITRLYAHLQSTIAERDRQHAAALRQEREKILIKRRLTNDINHELKTPVASILACLETIIEHPAMDSDKRQEFISRCYDNAGRLSRLLADVSVLTRIDDGAAVISREPTDIASVAADVATDMTERLVKAGISLTLNFPGPAVVEGNRQLLDSVFRNLIDNAISYSCGTAIDIRLESETPDGYVISVSDNGCGIPDEHLPRIFERFYRVDSSRSRRSGGTGLGLSIVKHAIMLHGGEVSACNRTGGGLRVTLSLRKRQLVGSA